MQAKHLYLSLRAQNLNIKTDGAHLFIWPKSEITQTIRQQIKTMKEELIDYIDYVYEYEERVAIIQYDGHLIRSEVEQNAL